MEQEKRFVEIEVSRKMIDMDHPVHNNNNDKDYVRIVGPDGSNFLYPSHGLHVKKDDENKITFSRPEGTEIQLRYSKRIDGVPDDAPNSEKWETITKTVTIEDLKEMYTQERQEYRNHIQESRKEKIFSCSFEHNDGDQCWDDYTDIYSLPNGKFLMERNDGYTGDKTSKNITPDEIRAFVQEVITEANERNGSRSGYTIFQELDESKLEAEKYVSKYVNMTVPSDWGYKFESKDGKEMVSVSVSIRKDNENTYWSFVMPAERFKESTKEEGMSYFGYPRNNPEGNEFMIHLKSSVKQENGDYKDVFMDISSEELKKHVDAAKERSAAKDRFISVEVSEKLIRPFTSSSGTELVAVAVPVYMNETDEKARFYEIVVPASRVKDNGRDGMQTVSLFRKNPDGESYTHVARFSEKNLETGEYEEQQMSLTSEEVVEKFKISAERYRDSQKSEHTIADELNQGKTANMPEQEEQAVRHHGR